MPATHSSTQRRSSLKCPALSHNPIRSLSLPTHHEKPQKSNRVRFAICTRAPQAETLRRPLNAPGSKQQTRPKVGPLAPTRIPCRIQSGRPNGISPRARKERSQAERNQRSKTLQATQRAHQRPRRVSSSHLERTRASSDGQYPNATLPLYIPSHSRAALSPCLSSPSKINCSISSSNPGGCEKLLQKIHRPVPASIDQNHQPASPDSVMDLGLKAQSIKAYTLSPSWCSPNIHSAVHKYNVSRSKTQTTDNEILSIFLKNNGGYLDDSDDEDDEEEEEEEEDSEEAEESFTSVRATVAFLKRIPLYPFEFRKPTSLSYSEQFNDLSILDISTSRSASDSSTSPSESQAHSSPPRYYWNRVLPTTPVTPTPKTRSRFTFYKK
ncbi:hypothetical protein PGTUg99_012488 [Puccinia graminis f. sp. tritici]|uniref:Uncharacterized protein n=1 Tax=Puccinia graminis f. sp. tritici TaxID=56615 RepID=A0A5B0M8E5_PUCGR|nr:hypothetical protein PGTUg99_012488 [Puccinia graminis f. sp. tritici]